MGVCSNIEIGDILMSKQYPSYAKRVIKRRSKKRKAKVNKYSEALKG